MKFLPLFFLLLIGKPAIVVSQSTWRDGIITTKEGISLKGLINDLEWDKPFKEIEFRKDGQTVEKYTARDIISFSTSRPVLFESHNVIYDGDVQSLKNLPYGKEPNNLVREKLFLEVKIDAEISLLYMQAISGRQHYFIKQDTTVVELLNRNYQNPSTNASMLTYQKYKQQLTLITNDCEDIQAGLKNLVYSENALRAVFTKINQCKNNPIKQGDSTQRASKPSNVGISIQGFRVNANYLGNYHSSGTDINFGVGIFWEFYNKKKPNRISIYNELIYKKIGPQHGVIDFGIVDADFNCSKIKLINALRFSYPNKVGGRFYYGIGLNNGVRMNTLIDGKSMIDLIEGGEEFATGFEFGFVAMIGETFVLFKSFKINTELRYEYEIEPSKSFIFNNIGLNMQFNLK